MTTDTAVPVALPDSPYRGIKPFRYVDHPIFFAREDEIIKLIRLVTVYRCVLLYGESGTGKSSLINAGFIPSAEEFAPERLRVQPLENGEIIVERISLQEEGQPPYLRSYFASTDDNSERLVLSAHAFRDRLMLFRAEDLEDPEELAARLKSSQDSVSVFLRERFSPSTRQLLAQHDEQDTVSDRLLTSLLEELNREVANRTDLYDDERFARVALSPETRQLLAQPPSSSGHILRNRLLLQDVYSQEIQMKPRPLLILDQFEELITLFEEAPRDREELNRTLKLQQSLLEVLATLLQDPALPIKLLFVFREDYLAKIRKRFAPRYSLPEQFFYLTSPRVAALHKIIRGPFEEFPGGFAKEIPEALAQRLAAQMRERSETGQINLSEVQIACLRLWQAEDPGTLFQQKGVQGLLVDYLSESLRKLSAGQYNSAELYDPALALLSRMVTRSGARNPISEDDLLDLKQYDGAFSLDLLKAALNALHNQARLVVRESRRDMAVYEIASEYLSPWIRDYRIQLEKRMFEQQASRERRKKKLAIAAAVAIFVLALILGAFANRVISNRNNSIQVLSDENLEQKEELIKVVEEKKVLEEKVVGDEPGSWKGIIGKGYTPNEFAEYVRDLQLTAWRPSLVVLHHAAIPLARFPAGITPGFLDQQQSFFRSRKFKSGPHLYIDDNKIWVFTPLTVSGTHAATWNDVSWGVLIIGDYDRDSPTEERAKRVIDNAVAALAILYGKINGDPGTLHLHKEDPRTPSACPGNNIVKEPIIQRVKQVMAGR